MKKTLIILFASSVVCFAQQYRFGAFNKFAQIASQASWSPTNTGFASVARYVADDFYTNSGTKTLPDRGGGGYSMIQSAAAQPTTGAIGSHRYIHFVDADYSHLSCATFPTVAQPFTISILWRPNSLSFNRVMDNTGANFRFQDSGGGSGGIDLYAGGYWDTGGSVVVGNWYATTLLVNGTSTSVNTNLATFTGSGNPGTGGLNATLDIGAQGDFLSHSICDIAEINIYSALIDAMTITNLYNYYKTNYPGCSLP